MLSVPKDYPVQPLTVEGRASAKAPATCNVCGRTWDDGEVTSMTPAPSARCPFEAFHGGGKVSEFRIQSHGLEHSQYFQGAGIAFSKWEDCATGIGSSEMEALDDALDSLAQNDWEFVGECQEELEREIKVAQAFQQTQENEHSAYVGDEDQCCEVWYYVTVLVKG